MAAAALCLLLEGSVLNSCQDIWFNVAGRRDKKSDGFFFPLCLN